MTRYELKIIEENIRTCSDVLNESLDILPISDGQSEIEAVAVLTTEYKALKDTFNEAAPPAHTSDFSKILKHIGTTLDKPKDTILDQIKALKV